jgi:hypothetical protein
MKTATITTVGKFPLFEGDKLDKAIRDYDTLMKPSAGNICYGDGYYANQLERDYRMTVTNLGKVIAASKRARNEARKAKEGPREVCPACRRPLAKPKPRAFPLVARDTFVQAMGNGRFYAYWKNRGADQDFDSYEAAEKWIKRCNRSKRFIR